MPIDRTTPLTTPHPRQRALQDLMQYLVRKSFQWSLGISALALLGACASHSDIAPGAKLLDAAPLGLTTPNGPTAATADAETQWWLAFQDPQLNALVQQALDNSPSLRMAQTRLSRAMAGSDAVATLADPKASAELSANRQRFSANGMFPPPIAGATMDSGTLQVGASWEFDYFGKNRAALDASIGQLRAAEADRMAARQLLATGVARSYYNLLRIQAHIEVAQRALALREKTLSLVQDRVRAGLDTQLELQQAESALPDARLQIAVLQEQHTLARNALAALTAQPADALKISPQVLPNTLPGSTLPQIPLDLLGRRMDIVAARWRIEAAVSDVEVSRAQFYPNINLTAFAGFNSLGLDRLLKTGSEQWGAGPAIRLPLFDSERLRANLRGKALDVDASVESYNAQVLEAVHDVADRLASTQAIVGQQREQTAAQKSAEAALELALSRYQAGLVTYLTVLSAEAPVLAQRRQAVDLAARAVDTRIQLLHALGGKLS